MTRDAALLERLCRASQRDAARATDFDWPDALPEDCWAFAPEWLSLYGTAAWEALDDGARRRLALGEAVNFFSLNIHGERLLIQGLERRLGAGGPRADYLRHFLREEQEHTRWFREFGRRYFGKLYEPRVLALPAEREPGEEDVVFFARVLVFEEWADAHNAALARDERLPPIARAIHARHHREEARHLAFGRAHLRAVWAEHAPHLRPETIARVRAGLLDYLGGVWADAYSAEVYRDAGLASPWALRRAAWEAPVQVGRRAHVLLPVRRFLGDCGLLPGNAS
jgi:hypothetical protein